MIIDLAKKNPVSPPELFASIVAAHFPATYKHISGARCSVIQHKWTRIIVDGQPHKHSFLRDGEDVRVAKSYFQRNKGFQITSGLENLLVLKSTGSAFHGHIKDKYTTLPDVYDRIFSTEVTANYNWRPFKKLEDIKRDVAGFDAAFEGVKETTLSTFATDDSASVQATMYKMCQLILAKFKHVDNVSYALPNKHYFGIDMSKKRLSDVLMTGYLQTNNMGPEAEVFRPEAYPAGPSFHDNTDLQVSSQRPYRGKAKAHSKMTDRQRVEIVSFHICCAK